MGPQQTVGTHLPTAARKARIRRRRAGLEKEDHAQQQVPHAACAPLPAAPSPACNVLACRSGIQPRYDTTTFFFGHFARELIMSFVLSTGGALRQPEEAGLRLPA